MPLDSKSPPNGSSSDRVAEAIGVGILKRRYLVGQRLVEADLMAELGVGRSTVREALKLLSATGVVELVPHRGAVIRAITDGGAAVNKSALMPTWSSVLTHEQIEDMADYLHFVCKCGAPK